MEQNIDVMRTSIDCFQELSVGMRDVEVTVGGHLVWKGTIEKASTMAPFLYCYTASLIPRLSCEEEYKSLGMGLCSKNT